MAWTIESGVGPRRSSFHIQFVTDWSSWVNFEPSTMKWGLALARMLGGLTSVMSCSSELLRAGIVLPLSAPTRDVGGYGLLLMITSFARAGPPDSALTGTEA